MFLAADGNHWNSILFRVMSIQFPYKLMGELEHKKPVDRMTKNINYIHSFVKLLKNLVCDKPCISYLKYNFHL